MPLAPQKINGYIVFDYEIGGLNPIDHPAMSLGCIGLNGTTLEEILRYDDLIRPYDNKLTYHPKALAVNGLSEAMCQLKGLPLSQVMENFCQVAKETNIHNSKTAKPILVGHNVDFDRLFLQDGAKRCEIDLSKFIDGEFDINGVFIPHVIDTIDLAKACWAERTENTTKYKLGHCCAQAGVNYTDGHLVMNDVESTADLFRYFVVRIRSGVSDVTVSEGKATAAHRITFEW